MAPQVSEDEIDDLIYFTRAGEVSDLNETLATLSAREGVSPAEILSAARDEGKSTCLHMATGNGNLGTHSLSSPLLQRRHFHVPNRSLPSPRKGAGLLEIVKILVGHFTARPQEEKQAFLDAPNEFGNTGLHWAAMGGHLDVVKHLVAEGASPALANDKNYIPLDLASFGEKMNVVDYFLSQMDRMESTNEGEGGLDSAAASMGIGEGEDEEEEEGEDEGKEEGGKAGGSGDASK